MQHAHDLLSDLTLVHLKSLSFTDNWIGEKLSDDFFEFMKRHQYITQLDFSLNWLRDKGVVRLVNSINPNLEQLHLSCNDFHSEGMKAISTFALNSPNLSELDVSYNHLDCNSAEHIAHLIKDHGCVSNIKASSNQIGDKGAAIIAHALNENTNQFKLDLSDNGITNEGAKHFIEQASTKGVKRQFDLRHNRLNKEELRPIVQAKKESHPLIEVLY